MPRQPGRLKPPGGQALQVLVNWAEWCAYAESAPATPAQVGAIRGEWRRLWPECGRETRLSTCAALLGCGELGSTTDLVLGDAGRLLAMLRGFASRAELAAAASSDGEDQAGEPAREELASDGVSVGDALVRVMPAAFAAWQGWRPRRAPAGNAGPGPVPAATPATASNALPWP